MKLIDKTLYRNQKGSIDVLGKIQGSIKFGLNWDKKLKAQDSIIGILDKVLDNRFYLLRNFYLPETDIELPIVLIGPPGIYLMNVVYQRGVYKVNNDEWGMISGDRFIPARLNQVQRSVKLARVINIFLERNEINDVPIVDPILIASDPGMHIETVQPAARIVMVDALERFAISMNQAPLFLNFNKIAEVAHKLVRDFEIIPAATPAFVSTDFSVITPIEILEDTSPIMGEQPFIIPQFNPDQPERSEIIQTFQAPTQKPEIHPGVPELGKPAVQVFQPEPLPVKVEHVDPFENLRPIEKNGVPFPEFDAELEVELDAAGITAEEVEPEPAEQTLRDTVTQAERITPARNRSFLGMTTAQLLILVGLFIFWLVSMAAFATYIFIFAR